MGADASHFFLGPVYAVDEVSDPDNGLVVAVLLLSHLVMLLGVALAFAARHVRLATAGLNSLIISAFFYHPCRANLYCLGVPVYQWRLLDHLAVLWLVGALGMHLMMTLWAPKKAQYFFVFAGHLLPAVAAISVITLPFTLLSGTIMGLYVLLIAIVRLSLLPCEGDLCGLARDNDPRITQVPPHETAWIAGWLVGGIIGLILGLVLYFGAGTDTLEGNSVAEALCHAAWHFLAGWVLFCFTIATSYTLEKTLRKRYAKLVRHLRRHRHHHRSAAGMATVASTTMKKLV